MSRLLTSERAISGMALYRRFLEEARRAVVSGSVVLAAQRLRQARLQPGCSRRKEGLGQWMDLYRSLPRRGLAGGWQETTFQGHTGSVSSVCLSSDGQYALSGGNATDSTLRLWEVATGRCARTFAGHGSTVMSVCLTADARYALSA